MLVKNEFGITKIIDALAIRNTNAAVSSAVNIQGYINKSIYINNGLNQNVSVQIQGCYDNSTTSADWVDIGTAQTVNTNVKAIIGAKEVDKLLSYFPYIRITVTAASNPTTGTISAYLMYA